MELQKIFILWTWLVITKGDQNIGLVHKYKNFLVSTNKEEFPIEVRFKIFSDLDYQVNLLEGIKTLLNGIENIPGIKNQNEIRISVVRQIRQSTVTADAIIERLRTINKYKGENTRIPSDPCFTEVAHNLDLLIFAANNFIDSSIKALGSYTVAEIAIGSTGYSAVLNVLQDGYLHLRTVEDKTSDYLSKLESLTSGILSSEIYSMVQMSPCIQAGEIDKLKIIKCEKTTTGLLCSLEVEIYLTSANYEIYGPVNYDGVQITLPPHKLLAKSPENTYGLLTCRDEATELVNDCKFSVWEPAASIFGSDHQKAIEENNFTLSDPPLPIQLYDGSILIMDKRVNIKTKIGEGTEKDTSNLSPMCIAFGKTATLSTTLDKIKLKFKGGTLDSGLEINTSIYNTSTIALMHSKAVKLAFWNMDWVNLLRYGALIMQVVILPVAFTTCSLSIYALIRTLINRRKKKRKEYIEKKYSLRRNYEINKRAAKRARK